MSPFNDRILLAHGGGGLLSSELIGSMIVERFGNDALAPLDDAALLDRPDGRLAFTTDSYVVSPVFFPGGNIGDLAVCGTVNDLAMMGAEPLALSLALILEEGLPMADLERVLDATRDRVEACGVRIVCGDTKVVPRGAADRIFINTSGVGAVREGANVGSANATPGDRLIVSGVVGLHGLAVMLSRGGFKLHSPLESDVAPLLEPVRALFEAGVAVRTLRDLTRGGLAMALHDIAGASSVTTVINETALPANETQRTACELLGLDPLHIACEGRFLAIVAANDADRAVEALRACSVSAGAAVVGEVIEQGRHRIELCTSIGSRRIVIPPSGEQMPRIC